MARREKEKVVGESWIEVREGKVEREKERKRESQW